MQTLINDSYGEEVPPALQKAIGIIIVVCLCAAALVSLCLNLIVFTLLSTTTKLQTLPLYLFLSTIITTTGVINKSSSVLGEGWIFGPYWCIASAFTITTADLVIFSVMAVSAIDSFFLVFVPLTYPRMRNRVVITLLLLSWLASGVYGTLGLPGILDCYGYQVDRRLCIPTSMCHSMCTTYNLIYWSLHVPPSLLPVLLYILIYLKSRRLEHNSSNTTDRIDYHAIITFFLLFLSGFFIAVPLNVIAIAVSYFAHSEVTDFVVSSITVVAVSLKIVADPVFVLCNRNVKEALKEIQTAATGQVVESDTRF